MPVVLPNTSRGSSTSNRLTSRTCHGSANSRITVSSARAAERCPPPALKYTRSMDFIVTSILRTENDKKMNIGLLAALPPCRGVKMRISRGFRHPWLLAASLVIGGAAAPAAQAAAPGSDTRVSGPAHTAAGNAAHLSHGRFKDFLVYRPSGPPTSFVLLLSGDEGWNSVADTVARQLVQQGAMVAGIDWAKFKANLEADGDQCAFPDGDLENLSHFVQAYFHNAAYLPPLLAGISSAPAMAYAMLAQAPLK